MRHRLDRLLPVLIGLLTLSLLWGCQDSGNTDTASLLEDCKIYLDEGSWSDAIDSCEEAGGDEGYHYAAQAYMGQGGLSLLNLIKTLSDSSNSSGSATAIFSFIPDNDTKKSSFQTALFYLMGSRIANKSQTVYLEALLLSSILVFTELKDVFGLSDTNGSFTTCDPDVTDDSDPAKCGFSVDVSGDSTPVLTFSGLGSEMYENLCCNLDSASCTAVGSTIDTTPDASADYNVTIDSCIIEARSVLQYNKAAYDGFLVTDTFKDSDGNNILAPLDFYTLFDSGNRYNISGDEIQLCKTSSFPDISSDDAELYDCEVLGAIFDPNSDLF
jgi:hypothetical protein